MTSKPVFTDLDFKSASTAKNLAAPVDPQDAVRLVDLEAATVGPANQPIKIETFSQANINASGLLIVLHNFGYSPRSVRVLDNNNAEVKLDDIQDNGVSTTVLNLGSSQPIEGIWTVIIGG